jgi:hypothetical protein
MATKPETRLVNRIRAALHDAYGSDGKWIKIHGSSMQERGLPDLLGTLRGRTVALEVKMPGEELSPLQAYQLELFAAAGATAAVVESVEEALAIAASVLQSSARSSVSGDPLLTLVAGSPLLGYLGDDRKNVSRGGTDADGGDHRDVPELKVSR